MLILYNVITTTTCTGGMNMTQVNITLSQEEVLQVLSGNRDDAFKLLVERILNAVMLMESEEQLGASRHERTTDRQDYRNGTRARVLNTRIGALTLDVPRHRNQPFHTMVFELPAQRSIINSHYGSDGHCWGFYTQSIQGGRNIMWNIIF